MRLLMLTSILLFACTSYAFEIDNIKFGLIDVNKKVVIPNTESVKYQVNGSCVVAGTPSECMWWGVSFNYYGLEKSEDIICSSNFSHIMHRVDTDKKDSKTTPSFNAPLVLDPAKSFYLGQYYVRNSSATNGTHTINLNCKYKGKSVINKTLLIDYGNEQKNTEISHREFDEGLAAANRGDFATALKKWMPLALQGNVDAQYNLGIMYESGQGVRTDYVQAVYWDRKAAEQGDERAQYNLGVMYKKGKGVTKDFTQALNWYRKAAEKQYAHAQFGIGLTYAHGEGVLQDFAEAVKWFRLAAKQGLPIAQYNLGAMYANGQGVPQDYVKAFLWINHAAVAGDTGAIKNRGIVAKKMTTKQISEALSMERDCASKKFEGCS